MTHVHDNGHVHNVVNIREQRTFKDGWRYFWGIFDVQSTASAILGFLAAQLVFSLLGKALTALLDWLIGRSS